MISPKHVLTAAHCIWDVEDTHQPMSDVAFAPAQNGAAAPFGNVPWTTVRWRLIRE